MQFGLAAAGQQRDHRTLLRHTELLAHRALVDFERDHVGQRVADIAALDGSVPVQLGLEGIQGKNVAHRLDDPAHPVPAPGPDRRTDEVDGGNAAGLESLFQPEIEVRAIDTDENIRLVLQQAAQELPAHGGDGPVVAQDFGIAAHRQHLGRPQRIEAFALHLRPADAIELRLRQMLLEGGDQVGGKLVAGGFAGHHGDAHHQRMIPRPGLARKPASKPSSGTAAASASIAARASSSFRPAL